MSYINVNGTGKIVTEPELKELSGDKCVIKLRIMATNKAGKDGNNMFIDLEAWDHLARNCTSLMSLGTYIIFSGRLQQDEWVTTKDNKTMTKVKITASDIGVQTSRWDDDDQERIKEAKHEIETLDDPEELF